MAFNITEPFYIGAIPGFLSSESCNNLTKYCFGHGQCAYSTTYQFYCNCISGYYYPTSCKTTNYENYGLKALFIPLVCNLFPPHVKLF